MAKHQLSLPPGYDEVGIRKPYIQLAIHRQSWWNGPFLQLVHIRRRNRRGTTPAMGFFYEPYNNWACPKTVYMGHFQVECRNWKLGEVPRIEYSSTTEVFEDGWMIMLTPDISDKKHPLSFLESIFGKANKA